MRPRFAAGMIAVVFMVSCGGAKHAGPASPAPTMQSIRSSFGTPTTPAAVSFSSPSADGEVVETASVESREAPGALDAVGAAIQELAGGGQGSSPPAPAPGAQAPPPEQLVVQAWLQMEVDDVRGVAETITQEVAKRGGSIVTENLTGAALDSSGQLSIRLPPAAVEGFFDWIAHKGDIVSKRVEATDVTRTLFDQELALQNNEKTVARLHELLEKPGLEMKDILAIETELTRLRGEIERIRGERRFLQDRVAMATIEVGLVRADGGRAFERAETKIYPGPRFAAFMLFEPGARERWRLGGGAVVHIAVPRVTLELDVFEDPGPPEGGMADEGNAVIATFGGAFYSDFLGRGLRRFLNPYIGARLGYAHFGGSKFALAGEVGLELFKHKYLLVDVNVRATALLGDDNLAGVSPGASVVFAF